MSLGLVLTGLFFLVSACALTFGAYFLARWCLMSKSDDQARELAGSVIFRVAALHGLILALVFAEELGNSDSLVDAVNREANQIESVYFDLGRYDTEQADLIRFALANYVHEVITTEWDSLDQTGELSNEAWAHREVVVQALLDLDAQTARQQWLRARMLDQMAAVETERNNREIIAATDVSTLFWVVAFVGIALVAAPYFPYAPNTANLTLLGLYSVYTGLVLFFIFAFDNPFASLIGVRPVALELFYNQFLHQLVS
ncbi:MAG: hypothetical protein AAF530_21835 [Pseudomonadota bacterium]